MDIRGIDAGAPGELVQRDAGLQAQRADAGAESQRNRLSLLDVLARH